jgi:hypothetical protein
VRLWLICHYRCRCCCCCRRCCCCCYRFHAC